MIDPQRNKMYDATINYTDKLIDFKAYLIYKRQIKKDNEIWEPAKADGGTFSKIMAGKNQYATEGYIEKIEKHFNVDLSKFNLIEELLKDINGNKLPTANFKRIDKPHVHDSPTSGGLALTEHYSNAGTGLSYHNDQVAIPIGYIKVPGYERCNFTKIITGHSMNDTLRNGDRVIGEQIQNLRAFEWGEIYNIVTRDHDITKRVNEDEEDNKYIWCCSDNQVIGARGKPRYQPIHILKKDIISAAYIRAAFNPIG